jgi:nitroreductase
MWAKTSGSSATSGRRQPAARLSRQRQIPIAGPIGYATTVSIFLAPTQACCAIETSDPLRVLHGADDKPVLDDCLTLDAIEALTTRASPLALTGPAPDAGALAAMLRAAARAPDHGKLKPWRFIVIAGDARNSFGDVLAEALRKREPELPESAIDKERGKPLRAPLIVVVGARLREHKSVPAVEQIVAAGAAAQNILVAAHALGFGGFWRTGNAAYDDDVKGALGLHAGDAIVGFLYLGTPVVPAPQPATSDHGTHVVHWTGPPDRDAGP